jgi:uncharacterized membrane protein
MAEITEYPLVRQQRGTALEQTGGLLTGATRRQVLGPISASPLTDGRERVIAENENELKNQIELFRREEQPIEQRGMSSRRQAAAAVAVDGIEARAERERHLADVAAHRIRALGEARSASEAAKVTSYQDTQVGTQLALAARMPRY